MAIILPKMFLAMFLKRRISKIDRYIAFMFLLLFSTKTFSSSNSISSSSDSIVFVKDTHAQSPVQDRSDERPDISHSNATETYVKDLDDFKMKALSSRQCRALDTASCDLTVYSDCENGKFESICYSTADVFEVKRHLSNLYKLLPLSPIAFGIFKARPQEMSIVVDSPMASNICRLTIWDAIDFDFETLDSTKLKNLIHVEFVDSLSIRLTKTGLVGFVKLRVLIFSSTTIDTFEKDVLESLPNLKTLVLDQNTPAWDELKPELQLHSYTIHCTDEYLWLRDYLKGHPGLLVPRQEGDLYNISGASNRAVEEEFMFRVIDCASLVREQTVNETETMPDTDAELESGDLDESFPL